MVGDGARELVRRLLEARDVAVPLDHALARFVALYNTRLVATTRPYEGVVEMLQDASTRARLAVLTNKPAKPTERLLDAFDLRKYFADVVAGDGDLPRKPDPAGLTSLVERAGVDPSRALMVGDSPADVQTALNAGVPMCLVRYGFGFAKVSGLERARAAYRSRSARSGGRRDRAVHGVLTFQNRVSYEKYVNRPTCVEPSAHVTGIAAPRMICASPWFHPPRSPGETTPTASRSVRPGPVGASCHVTYDSSIRFSIGRSR